MSYSLERCYKRKGITMTNAFPKILHEPNHKPSKIRVDKSKTKLTILFCFTVMKIKSLTAPKHCITLLLFNEISDYAEHVVLLHSVKTNI